MTTKDSNLLAYSKSTHNELLAEVAEMVCYDKETGAFTWKVVPSRPKEWNTRRSGKTAGTYDNHGYRYLRVTLNGKPTNIKLHRLAFFMGTGTTPDGEIDHINGTRDDNRLSNLRVVSSVQNRRNMKGREDNTSGYVGVSWSKANKKWHAYEGKPGKGRVNSFHDSKEDAIVAARTYRVARGYSSRHINGERM